MVEESSPLLLPICQGATTKSYLERESICFRLSYSMDLNKEQSQHREAGNTLSQCLDGRQTGEVIVLRGRDLLRSLSNRKL
jgi:hypothetical protein